MNGVKLKMKRLLSKGNAVIIACDHGEFDGPIPGMLNIAETLSHINRNVDGVLISPGMLRHTGGYFARRNGPAVIGRLNWNTVYCFHWNYNDATSADAFSPREAARLGVEIALVSLTLKTGSEDRDAQNVGIFRRLTSECHDLGIPVIGEYFPAHSDTISPEAMHSEIKIGCRILAELGTDMIKTFYTNNFREVVAGCPASIFALGAVKLPRQIDALTLAFNEVADGAQGVVFGRNALQVTDPSAFQAALMDVVKKGIKPEEAAQKHKLKD